MNRFSFVIALVLALVATYRVEAQRSPFDTSDIAESKSPFDTSFGEQDMQFVSTSQSDFDTTIAPVQAPTEKPVLQTVTQSPVQKSHVQYTYYIKSSAGDDYAGIFGRQRRVERRQMRREGRGGLFGLRGGC